MHFKQIIAVATVAFMEVNALPALFQRGTPTMERRAGYNDPMNLAGQCGSGTSVDVLKCYTDKLLGTDIGTFFTYQRQQFPQGLVWASDGCSVPILSVTDKALANNPAGFDFLPSCTRHDFAYRNYNEQKRCALRPNADNGFDADMNAWCNNNVNNRIPSCGTWDVTCKLWDKPKAEAKAYACHLLADTYADGVREFAGAYCPN